MEQVAINWLAVLAASVVGFATGGLWYGPLFGKPWMKSLGIDPETINKTSRTSLRRILSITFILQYVMALCLAFFIGNEATATTGLLYGFLTGLPWVAFALTINALYEQKPASYIFINGAYWTVTFSLMGLILGAWQ